MSEIIHSYGIIQQESLIIIMEYASNGSLRDYLNDHKNTPLSKDLVCSLISDIKWNGLFYSHDVEHRDLKTDNILLDNELCVKYVILVYQKGMIYKHIQNEDKTESAGGTLPCRKHREFKNVTFNEK